MASSTVANIRAAAPELSKTEVLVAAHLAEAGGADYERLAEAVGCAKPTAQRTVQALADAGYVTLSERETDGRGRNPTIATATAALETAADAGDGVGSAVESMQADILAALAVGHYLEERPSLKAKEIASRTGRRAGELSTALGDLHNAGAIEDALDGGSPRQWRLVGAWEVVPFYAGEASESDDGQEVA